MSDRAKWQRLTSEEIERIRDLRYGDGLTLDATAAIIGCSSFAVQRYAPGSPGKIENARLREAFVASGRSAADVARALGWVHERTIRGHRYMAADTSRVRRTLGLIAQTSIKDGRRYRSMLKLTDAETAARIAEAIGVGPWEIGA